MPSKIQVTRTVTLPNPTQVERCLRAPELGPKILFFSGGSALRALSRELKRYTHNSIHLITAFDSGGSSASLRKAFNMLSVGDLRNRLMALADESALGNPAIYELFSHRFEQSADQGKLGQRLRQMIEGKDLVASIPTPMRRIIRTHLRLFAESAPADFDLRGASIGNLILAGGHRLNEGDMDSVIYLFSKLVAVRGTVLPIVDADLHLGVQLDDGSTVVGQHCFTGKGDSMLTSKIRKMWLCKDLGDPSPVETSLHQKVKDLILGADLIVYPMGSFWSSLMANLMPAGVGEAVAAATCPKIYVPSTGHDPELVSTSIDECAQYLLRRLRQDAGTSTHSEALLNGIILDSNPDNYPDMDIEKLESLGIPVAQVPMTNGRGKLQPDKLAQVLLSLC